MPSQMISYAYAQLQALPEGLTGEVLDGQVYAQPRPAARHARAEGRLLNKVGRGYDEGDGGPGGWWILVEPEVHFIRDQEVCVPDLAGWRRERMPRLPEGHRFEVVPDWVCEILSPSTASKDREVKMPIYARYGVAYVWLVDPLLRTMEAYALTDGEWRLIAQGRDSEVVTAAPFDALALDLPALWS
ncbi:Uma2 family endonuclease [Gammaproteobacteria bacterium]